MTDLGSVANLFRSAWKEFSSRFKHLIENLASHKALVESRANATQIQEARAARTEAMLKFSMLEKKLRQEKYL